MSYAGPFQPSVVVYVNGSSQGDDRTVPSDIRAPRNPHESAFDGDALKADHVARAVPLSQRRVQGRRVDPGKLAVEWPEMWATYIRAQFSDLRQIMQAFDVSESCARKWWNADGGCSGRHVATAYAMHPSAVTSLLLAAE